MMQADMLIPLAVYQTAFGTRCPECDDYIWGRILSLGVQKNSQGKLCMAFDVICGRCGAQTRMILDSFPITRPDWWNQIQEWYMESMKDDPNRNAALLNFFPRLLRAKLLLRGRDIQRIRLYGGYREEGGATFLLFDREGGTNRYGIFKLEPEDRVRCTGLKECECLPYPRWPWFFSLPDGMSFEFAQRRWMKLPESEIERAVNDTVFSIARKPPLK
jgi:hypothetical protein